MMACIIRTLGSLFFSISSLQGYGDPFQVEHYLLERPLNIRRRHLMTVPGYLLHTSIRDGVDVNAEDFHSV